MRRARNASKEIYVDLSDNDIEVLKHNSEKKKTRQQYEIAKVKVLEKQTQHVEFLYLEELNQIEYYELQNNYNWVVYDPGKRVLLYMENKNGVCIRYSIKEHLHKKQVKYQKLI